MAAVRALWLTPALLGSALALALPSAAAPSKAPRWKYDVNFVEGEATFTWSGVGSGEAEGLTADGTAKVTFFSGALKGTGFLDLGLGGGTVRIRVTATWTEENYTLCDPDPDNGCKPGPCPIPQRIRTEPGGLSFKIVGRGERAVVRYTWNLPQAEPQCSAGFFWPLELGELKLKQGKMTQSAPLSTFAKRQIWLTLKGSVGARGSGLMGSFIGTDTWHAVVLLKRK